MGIGGPKKPEEDEEKLFETIGKAADKIGETQVGKKICTIITVVMLAILSGGANMSIIHEFLNGEEDESLMEESCAALDIDALQRLPYEERVGRPRWKGVQRFDIRPSACLLQIH